MCDLVRAYHHTEGKRGMGGYYKPLMSAKVMHKGKGVIVNRGVWKNKIRRKRRCRVEGGV